MKYLGSSKKQILNFAIISLLFIVNNNELHIQIFDDQYKYNKITRTFLFLFYCISIDSGLLFYCISSNLILYLKYICYQLKSKLSFIGGIRKNKYVSGLNIQTHIIPVVIISKTIWSNRFDFHTQLFKIFKSILARTKCNFKSRVKFLYFINAVLKQYFS